MPTTLRYARYVAAALLGAAAALIWQCGPSPANERVRGVGDNHDPLRAAPSAFKWEQLAEPAFPLPPYAKYLAGTHFVIDPGHGGRADRANWKRGPTGLREAEVNLAVARELRDFLQAAGATVSLTRSADVYLAERDADDLQRRADLANDLHADLFVSIHHNAASDPTHNYTSIFYHAATAESLPASRDAGRHVLAGLAEALRLPQQLPSPLLSDDALFPGRGLAVLRNAEVPAILVESSFHSNPAEEQRLRDPLYNRREAYGIFRGLARWAAEGLPRVRVAPPDASAPARPDRLRVLLDDGLSDRGGWGADLPKIQRRSLIIELDGVGVPAVVNWHDRWLEVDLPSPPPQWLFVDFANVYGNHVLHPWIPVAAPPDAAPPR